MDNRRMNDKKLEEIAFLVREIHQRQTERTIPAITKIEHTLYGNSKKGLCDFVVDLEAKLNSAKYFVGITLTIFMIAIALLELFIKTR